jgi:hypothetical protein
MVRPYNFVFFGQVTNIQIFCRLPRHRLLPPQLDSVRQRPTFASRKLSVLESIASFELIAEFSGDARQRAPN